MDQVAPPDLPDLQSLAGVAAALMTTLGSEQAVEVLLTQFGWDVTFTALSHMPGPHGGRAMWLVLLAQVSPRH